MTTEERLNRIEAELAALKEQVAIAQEREAAPVSSPRHPDMVRRAPFQGDAGQHGHSPLAGEKRSKGCLAIAAVLIVLFAIAFITAMSQLGKNLEATFNNVAAQTNVN